MQEDPIVVVGGGAAGIFAAIGAAEKGAPVLLLEKKARLGMKLRITGKGRCNLTNMAPLERFLENIPGNGRFLYGALSAFSNHDLISYLNKLGIQTKVERGGRVFPVSDVAGEVVKLLENHLRKLQVTILFRHPVTGLLHTSTRLTGVQVGYKSFPAKAVILATGGLSYPTTGSTGDGYLLAQKLGHQVTPLRPSLVPLELAESWVGKLKGLSLKNVKLTVYSREEKIDEAFGEMLFTDFGISGPIVLTLSREISRALEQDAVKLKLNLKPALDQHTLDQRLLRDFQKYSNKYLKNALKDLLPQALILPVIHFSNLRPDRPVHQITKKERRQLVSILQGLPMTVVKTRPIEEAIITSGGICIKEVNPKTMGSKIMENLFFAGEILDVDGYTGGFNLQAAFSTGYLAGKTAAELCCTTGKKGGV
ncbi:MAG: NAD(P)/FAD-dependent oxidoreductase [Clostridia bacterium]|nr:NAD(P)/FAD-dependent oxidoreductase [Clostridia bacterium]